MPRHKPIYRTGAVAVFVWRSGGRAVSWAVIKGSLTLARVYTTAQDAIDFADMVASRYDEGEAA